MIAVRKVATWLLVGAVAALGVAAGVDALRGRDAPEPPSAEAEPRAETTVAETPQPTLVDARQEADRAGVPVGVLTYADEDCRLHSVTLPDLGPHSGPEGRACVFRSTVGNELSFGEPPPSPFGDLRLRCRRGEVQLVAGSLLYASAPGRCGIAWKPDGTPTFLRGGKLMRFAPCAGELGEHPMRCTRTLLSRAELAREMRRARWTRFDVRLQEVHWLSNRRFAAIVRASSVGGGADLLAVFEDGRLVSGPTFAYEDLDTLRPSPLGTHVAARIGGGGLAVVDRGGNPVRLAMTHGRAVTWSPDEEWIAEATDDGVYLFRTGDQSPIFVRVPIIARDLVWR
jgi:hypothetical protein